MIFFGGKPWTLDLGGSEVINDSINYDVIQDHGA